MTDLLDAIRRHRGLALRIARSMATRIPRHIQRDDLEQAALIGLFDWKRAHPDETVEGWLYGMRTRIRGSIRDELRRQDWLPRDARKANPTLRVYGFDDLSPGMEDALPSADESTVARIERNETIAEAMLAEMGSRDAQVIRLHYFRGKRFKDIGSDMGCSETRISQLHHRALGTMRGHLERVAKRESVRHMTSTLPEEGVDLRAELARYQDWMVEQALIRTGGCKAKAARLLGIERTCLVEMLKHRRPLRPGPKQPAEDEPKTNPGATRIPRAEIARLKSEGKTTAQAARELGCSRWLVEREYTRLAPIAKARPR